MIQRFRALLGYEPHDIEDEQITKETFGCLTCRKRCRTRAGEAAHMFKAHGQQAQRVADWSTPRAVLPALKNIIPWRKVIAHLYYSTSCRRLLQSRNYVCTPEPGAGSTQDRDLKQQHDRLLPPLRQEGPQQQMPRLREDPGIDGDLHMELMEIFLETADAADSVGPHPANPGGEVYVMDYVDTNAALLRGHPGRHRL